MQGEIMVMEVMAASSRRARWWARQQRDAEWVALKQWWRAERRVRQAATPEKRRRAQADRDRTVGLYRAELARAWPKWQRARQQRWGEENPPGGDEAD